MEKMPEKIKIKLRQLQKVNKKAQILEEEINKINQCSQRQDSLTEQMLYLYIVANKLGLYDAADYIKNTFKGKMEVF